MGNLRAALWETARPVHDRYVESDKAGGPCEPPAVKAKPLLAHSFLSSFHLLLQLGFDCRHVKARTRLHRRIIEEGLGFLRDLLLHEDEAPELTDEPSVVVNRPVDLAVRPAGSLERVQAKIDQRRPIYFLRSTEPAIGLVGEAVFVVVYPHGCEVLSVK